MANFKQTVITKAAHNLIAKSLSGSANINFTRVATSKYDYKSFSQSKLESLTSLEDIKQYVAVDKVEKIGESSVNVSVKITNANITEGYYVNTIGLFAIDPEEGEILYSVTVAETADYFPADNGVNCSGINLDLVTEVSNASNVNITVNYAGYATNEDIEKVNSQLNDFAYQITQDNCTSEFIQNKIDSGYNIYSNDVIETSESIVLDLKGKIGTSIKLKIKPSDILSNAITIQNGYNTNIDIEILEGGNIDSTGLIIINLKHPEIKVYGKDFSGTLFKPIGTDTENNKNSFCSIEVISSNCGKAIDQGDELLESTAFGEYKKIYDSSKNGSTFKNCDDITIKHYENAFFQSGKTSLKFDNCKSIYFGNCALGGICELLLDINKSFVHFSKLLLINDKKDGIDSSNMNGIKIRAASLENTGNTSMVSIDTLDCYNLNNVIDIDSYTNLSINTIRPHANNTTIIIKDNINLNLPNYMPSSFSTRKKDFIDDDSSIIYKNINLLERIKDTGVIKRGEITMTADTTAIPYKDIVFDTPMPIQPSVILTPTSGYLVYVNAITVNGFRVVWSKSDGSNFSGTEALKCCYIAISR